MKEVRRSTSNGEFTRAFLILLMSPLLCDSNTARAEEVRNAAVTDTLSVDCGKILSESRGRFTGVNVDFLMDDDRNPLLSPRRKFDEALRELGPKFLRYPGGWKSAINLWSIPPYDSSRPTLAGRVPEEWIRRGLQLANPDGSWRIHPLGFDEFMDVCRYLNAGPCVVTAYESCYWPPTRDWQPPSRERLIETAVAWVRYANKVKQYGVKYWEIGNETWLNNETWTNHITASTYVTDLMEFSRRMKEVDGTLQIGANGDTDAWWREVLTRAADHIDFLSVHAYPCWKWTNYDAYRTNSPDVLGSTRTAANAIANYAPAHKQRIKIALTEFAAGTFGDWDKTPADLGRGLITFDLQGQSLQSPLVRFSQFWTTHNVYSEVDGDVFETLKRDNTLSPIGRALWIWNHFLGDAMVSTTSSPRVRCYASLLASRKLTIFLLNKDTSASMAKVALQRLPAGLRHGEQWVWSGTGPTDCEPTWARVGPVAITNSQISLRLPAVSLTVIQIAEKMNSESKTP